MSTLQEMNDNVLRSLDDLSASFFESDKDVKPSLQDGYNLIAALCETIEKHTTLNFIDDLVYYDFSTLIPDYLRVYGIFNNAINRWLEPLSFLQLLRMREDWELMNQMPRYFVPVNYRYTIILPTQNPASGSMTILYKAKADVLGDNSVPNIPIETHKTLEQYSTEDMLDQCEEFYKSMTYFSEWTNGIEAIKKAMRDRSSPNYIFHKRDVNFQAY